MGYKAYGALTLSLSHGARVFLPYLYYSIQ